MYDPERWGLCPEAAEALANDLERYWERYAWRFRTRTRDTSHYALLYWRGQMTMDDKRNYTNLERRLTGGDGQALQQFMSDSPWDYQGVFEQIRLDILAEPALQSGGVLILDESADEKAGLDSAGAGRQHNGRQGKVDVCQVATCLAWAHPATGTWALVAGELYVPQAWFTPAYAERRAKVGLPAARRFASKVELGWEMIQRVQAHGLPFEVLACDEHYGRARWFRAQLAAAGIRYAAEVPGDTPVYLHAPRVGLPSRRARKPQVLSKRPPREVRRVARDPHTTWRREVVRHTERGLLEADFAVRPVWTLTEQLQVRAEWLVMRRDLDGRLTYSLLNAPADTPTAQLIEWSCVRYWTERTYQDAKSELGWDDFAARKYRAWQHHLALTASALWFIAQTKLHWHAQHARDPDLLRQFDLEVLPRLSTANVREMLKAALPLPRLTPERARQIVVTNLVNRARSTGSRLRARRAREQPEPDSPHHLDSS